jgi:imidazoleglycerol phosphate synthase glutamine amidotransferase subunit HisH
LFRISNAFFLREEFGFTKGLNIVNGKVKSLKSLKVKEIIPNLGWKIKI